MQTIENTKKNPRTVDSSGVYIMEQGTGIEPVNKDVNILKILHFFGLHCVMFAMAFIGKKLFHVFYVFLAVLFS